MTGPATYLRGARPGQLPDARRAWLVTALVAGGLAVLTAAVTLWQGWAQARLESRLRTDGIPVAATVTSCYGLASGTGITNTGWVCRASFRLHGQRYIVPLRGSTALHHPGDVLAARALPGDPPVLEAIG